MTSGDHPTQPQSLEIIPLGGLGEFGMNMTALRYGDGIIVVDVGLMFPDASFHGVDYVVPDMTYLREAPGTVQGVFLSHGHDDHIGALPHLCQRLRAPVYGTALTLGLARLRLAEYGIDADPGLLREVHPGDIARCGPFSVEFIRVTHSIPDAVAMAIRTPLGTIVHTCDFKIDYTPVDDRLFDIRRFGQIGDEGILALLSDSTNASRPGFTPSEREVGAALEPLIKGARGRVIVTTFASNIHRIQQVIHLAARQGRKVALLGRSISGNAQVSRELGYLHVPADVMVDCREISRYPPERIAVIASGSQGEPMSAMSRVALGDHGDLAIGPGDLVIVSARRIPGNERRIGRMINHVCRRGADILLDDTHPVHVSGHASREELKLMLALTRPRNFIPVHGDYQHLSQHARLALELGLAPESVLLAETGDRIEIRSEEASVVGKAPVGTVFIDGTLDQVDEIVIRDRRHIAEDGVIMPIVVIDKHTGAVESPPELVSRGFVGLQDGDPLFEAAGRVVMESIGASSVEERADDGFIKMRIQADLRRFIRKRTQRRPLIIPVVLEV